MKLSRVLIYHLRHVLQFCCRFEYNAASDLVKEIEFEEVEGMWQMFCFSFPFSFIL